MFPIVFNTRQALPLPFGTFLRPRIGRVVCAERARNSKDPSPQTRHFHEHRLIRNRARTENIRVREQSAATFNPRFQALPQAVRSREPNAAPITREQSLASITRCLTSSRVREMSTDSNLSLSLNVHEFKQPMKCPLSRIPVTVAPAMNFQFRIKIIPAYVRV